MKALVTGGAGFIGSSLARKLISLGDQVTVVDDLSTGYESNIPKGCQFVRGDVSNWGTFKKLDEVMTECDVVYHIAGQSSGEISYDNPARDLDINAKGTLLCLEWGKSKRIKKFVFASTMAIYGDNYQDRAVDEKLFVTPKSFYAISKMTSEHLLRIYRDQFNVPSTALRLFNVYGPGQNMANMRQGMASIFMAYYLSKRPILVKGSEKRFRDLVYIDDVVAAFLIAAKKDTTEKVFNIGHGTKTTVRTLLDTMFEIDGLKPGEYPVEFGQGTPGDIFGIYSNISLAKEHLNWEPKTDLKAGLKQMIIWAREEMHRER